MYNYKNSLNITQVLFVTRFGRQITLSLQRGDKSIAVSFSSDDKYEPMSP